MATPQFPESEAEVQATLIRVLELKGLAAEAQLVRMASLSIEYADHDNWNSGVDYFAVGLKIPLEVFVQLESELEDREKALAEVCKFTWRDYADQILSLVRISPDRATTHTTAPDATPSYALPDFWDTGSFRLFLSHCHSQRAHVAELKVHLRTYGVTAFVAHDDVAPSTLWQTEIEKGLRTCEALVAVISPDFADSLWCDQEVGWALGRGVPVLPVQVGAQPHGFIGKIQSIAIPKGLTLSSRATTIAAMLMRAPQTALSMTNALVGALAASSSYAQAKAAAAQLETVDKLTAEHARVLRAALKNNSQVYDAIGVPERIARILKSLTL